MLYTNLESVIRETKHWPNKKMLTCWVSDSDGTQYQADILPEEVALIKLMRTFKLSKSEFADLAEAINNFGDARYNEGVDDEQQSNGGAEY